MSIVGELLSMMTERITFDRTCLIRRRRAESDSNSGVVNVRESEGLLTVNTNRGEAYFRFSLEPGRRQR